MRSCIWRLVQAHKFSWFIIQDAQLGAVTPRRSRVSSIFQQKTIKPDDIDADFLKHVQFAAQRGSPSSSVTVASASAVEQQSDPVRAASASEPAPPQAALSSVLSGDTNAAEVEPASVEEFTLAKIEQSIADIEAELGWVSDAGAGVVAPVAGTSEDVMRSAVAPAGILSTAHADKALAAPLASTAGSTQHNSTTLCAVPT